MPPPCQPGSPLTEKRRTAGLADAAGAAAATFAVQIWAANMLTATELGIYAIVFRGFSLVALVPANLIARPLELEALSLPHAQRLHLIRRSLVRIGLLAAAISGLLPLLAGLVSANHATDVAQSLPLGLTAAAAGLVSPLQDHARRLLHVADRSAYAALMSMVQLVSVVVGLIVAVSVDIAPTAIPFGVLAIANVISLAVGVFVSMKFADQDVAPRNTTSLRDNFTAGRWLLTQEGSVELSSFLANIAVAEVVGLRLLGFAEAARIVSQPIFVIGRGLSESLQPRAMDAAAGRDHDKARNVRRQFYSLYIPLSALALVVLGFPWTWNPLAALLPKAYEIGGLAVFFLIARSLAQASSPFKGEALGFRFERKLAALDVTAGTLRLSAVIAALAVSANIFSLPIGGMLASLFLLFARARLASRGYNDFL